MRKLPLCLLIASLSLAARAQAQVIGPGSTVEGDVRRGEGVFLQGLGWYEINNAKAFDRYSKAMRENDAYLRQQIAEGRRAYAAHGDAVARQRKLNDVQKKQYLAERETTLRTRPATEDIEKGDALNALLVDLSDPQIHPSSWRDAKVDLPADISIKALAFQFTPRPGAKASAALSQGLIALGRLDTAGRWPDVFPPDKLKPEIAAYEAAYATIREQSRSQHLETGAVLAMDRSLKALRSRVESVIPPERGFRAEAMRYVDNLIAATRMFDASTLGYAREMIADTGEHEAHNVGELLAFMRKYRLVFAKADAAPGGDEMYRRLYELLRDQKKLLGLDAGGVPPRAVVEAPATDARRLEEAFRAGSEWESENGQFRMVVLDRQGEAFQGRFSTGGGKNLREVRGKVGGGKVVWLHDDSTTIKGEPGHDNLGTFLDNRISVEFKPNGRAKGGTYALRLKKG